jgi:putative hydrolase of the HAD superfamily
VRNEHLKVKAVIFDLVQTLVEFREPHFKVIRQKLGEIVKRFDPTMTDEKMADTFQRIWDAETELRMARHEENDLAEVIHRCFVEFIGPKNAEAVREEALACHEDATADVLRFEPHVPGLLREIKRDFRLGLISNFPTTRPVVEVFQRDGLYDLFDAFVISYDLNLIKPSPRIFAYCLQELGVAPGEAMFVGDDWALDMEGAHAAGLNTCHFTGLAEETDFPYRDGVPTFAVGDLRELPNLIAPLS